MKHLEIIKIGNNKGAPRIWMEGRKLENGGFLPGKRYSVKVDASKPLLTLEIADSGMRIVSHKQRGDREFPVIDLNSTELMSVFAGLESVRVVVQDQRIHILPVASELRANERLTRLRDRLAKGEPLVFASAASGIGILDMAAHEGLAMAGLESKLATAVEIRDDCMDWAAANNPVYSAATITITAPMQEVAFDEWTMQKMPVVDCFTIGIPCSGASVAGRTKRGLAHPEDHPEVGHMLVPFLAMVARQNPVAIVLECVVPYRSSASASIIRNMLRDLCYTVHETELDASDWNMLEHRKRYCLVAVTNGIEFSFDDLVRPAPVERKFGEIMEAVPADHSTWGRIDYLWSKLERDKQAGKGFSPTVIDSDSTRVPTLNKTLHKRQSTGTFIRHPDDPDRYRIPTVAEHAACKGVPPSLVKGTTQTFGHEILGQAISVPPFVAVFELLAHSFMRYVRTPVEQRVAGRSMAAVSA